MCSSTSTVCSSTLTYGLQLLNRLQLECTFLKLLETIHFAFTWQWTQWRFRTLHSRARFGTIFVSIHFKSFSCKQADIAEHKFCTFTRKTPMYKRSLNENDSRYRQWTMFAEFINCHHPAASGWYSGYTLNKSPLHSIWKINKWMNEICCQN